MGGGLYIFPWNRDAALGNSRMEAFLSKPIKVLEGPKSCLKEIKANILGLRQKVDSHETSIKLLKLN